MTRLWADEGFEGTGETYDQNPAIVLVDTLGTVEFLTAAGRAGYGLRITGDGATDDPYWRTPLYAVREGDVVEFGGWVRRGTLASNGNGQIQLMTYAPDQTGETVRFNLAPSMAVDTWADAGKRSYRIPSGVGWVRVECFINDTDAPTTEVFDFDDVFLRHPLGFHIIAQGVLSLGPVTAGTDSASETLTALGDADDVPAVLFLQREVIAGASEVQSGSLWTSPLASRFVAASSGGSPTSPLVGSGAACRAYADVSSGTPRVSAVLVNGLATSVEIEVRYYVLAEEGGPVG